MVKVSLVFWYRLLFVLISLMSFTDFYSHDGIILVTNITELLLHGYSFTSTFELSSIITTTQTLFLIFIYHGNQYQSHICIYASLFFTYLS